MQGDVTSYSDCRNTQDDTSIPVLHQDNNDDERRYLDRLICLPMFWADHLL